MRAQGSGQRCRFSKDSIRIVQGRGRGVHPHQATGWILHVQPSKLGELYPLTPILPTLFVVGTHLAILRQELRKAIREVNSPSPQPEDPDRALSPGPEEDPDIFVELIDRQFYQLSCDDAMVAIMADYPGLLPASLVRKTKIPTPKTRIPF